MHIRRAVAADLPQLGNVSASAFLNEKLAAWLYPLRHTYHDDFVREWAREISGKFYSPGHVIWVAEADPQDPNFDSAARLLGFGIWKRHGSSATAQIWQEDSVTNQLGRAQLATRIASEDAVSPDRSGDAAHLHAFESLNDVFEAIHERWHLLILAVRPECKGRGIGSMLTQVGLDLATREQVPATLESTIDAEGVYRRLGFRDYAYVVLSDEVDAPSLIWVPTSMKDTFGTNFPPWETIVGKGEGRRWKPVNSHPERKQHSAV